MPAVHRIFVPCLSLAMFGWSPLLLPAESAPVTPPTAQQIYNDAQEALEEGHWADAIIGYNKIAKPDTDGTPSRTQGVIHARLAQAYSHAHQIDKALAEAGIALKGLASDDHAERATMWLAIADAQRADLDLTQSAASYEKALESARQAKSADLVISAGLGLAMCDMTVDPARSARVLDAILAAPETASKPELYRAQIYDLRGRASLNLGQPEEAVQYLDRAIKLSGGMEHKQVNWVQMAVRGDAALGALLTDRPDDAKKYLTWTGAGHLKSEEWTNGLGDPPVCNEAAGIRPSDMVVVEFSIAANGGVPAAVPIYATRPGTLGVSFAQAVRKWKWNPAQISDLPPFWRNMLRIEMRCIAQHNAQHLITRFYDETKQWLSGTGLAAADLESLWGVVPANDPRLDREDLAAIPALFTRLRYEKDDQVKRPISKHLNAALAKVQAPVVARALAMYLQPPNDNLFSWTTANIHMKADQVASLERTDPPAVATAWLTLEYAIALERDHRFKAAQPVLDRVIAYPKDVLDEHDPVRIVAILHRSALQRQAGDAAGADQRTAAAGLNRAQCMLFDLRPVATDTNAYSTEFPAEALRWGFDGFVRVAFDIEADGHVQNARTVLTYPPYIFGDAAEKTASHFRYLAPVVDGGAVGCDGYGTTLRYTRAQ